MSYSKSTEFLHLPQYSELDVLNVLSDFNKAMINIDFGVSTIQSIVNTVLLSGNLTQDEVNALKVQIVELQEKEKSLENTLGALSSNVEQFENTTTENLEKMNTAILNCATEKQLQDRTEQLLAMDSALQSDIDSVEELSSANNAKIQTLQTYVPEIQHLTSFSYTLNNSSENTLSDMDLKIATTEFAIFRHHDIYLSFDYATTQSIEHDMELRIGDITPIHELLWNIDFTGNATIVASGYTSGGSVMPMSAGLNTRYGKIVITFTDTSELYLPSNSGNHITIHISGYTLRSDI